MRAGMTALMMAAALAAGAAERPNVVIILADDLGFGDVGCYGATKIRTPNIDRLAAEGRSFLNAYTPGSVCSPTRYGLMAGRYFWREPRHHPTGVHAPGAPLLFPPERLTLAKLFQQAGYRTGAVGKWHLGFGEGDKPSARYDFSQEEIRPGPLEAGFDWFFGMAANVGNSPKIYIEDHRFVGRGPDDKVEMVGRAEVKPWSPDAEYTPDHVAGDIAAKAVAFIQGSPKDPSAGAGRADPFFLYVASNIAHNDITPSAGFAGKSPIGRYGDFVEELDAQVGMIVKALEESAALTNTLILFTSDNGGVAVAPDAPPAQLAKLKPQNDARLAGHAICGALRGRKHSIYEGGFRVPFIVRWPGHVPAGTRAETVICLTDVLASCAELLGRELPRDAGEDSFSALAAWQGDEKAKVRDHVILDSANGIFAIREGDWKLIERNENLLGEGGRPMRNHAENRDQLYHLARDPAETNNLWAAEPERVAQLREQLAAARRRDRTRP